jgi:hypothetical protein
MKLNHLRCWLLVPLFTTFGVVNRMRIWWWKNIETCENLRSCLEFFEWIANDLVITSYWMSRKPYGWWVGCLTSLYKTSANFLKEKLTTEALFISLLIFYFILFVRKQMQSIHSNKKRENSQGVFGIKEMRFKPRPTTEAFPHHLFGWAAIFWPESTTAVIVFFATTWVSRLDGVKYMIKV